MKRTAAGGLGPEDVGREVFLQGWVERRRDHGGVVFLDLRDRSGIVQVVVRPEDVAELSETLDEVRIEWVIEIVGEIASRSPEAVNSKLSTGEIEVVAKGGRVLSRCDPLPFSIEEGKATEETRLRYRYLDLRRPQLAANLALRHRVVADTMKYFDEQGFLHVETPHLTRSTPEGARDYLVPSRVHRGEFYALPQSPQLFKQILMVSGVEKYFQICRCFRDEDLRADRQPEFSQIDVELSFTDPEQIFDLIEGLARVVFPLGGIEPVTPFPRMEYAEAMRRFGSDRPDLGPISRSSSRATSWRK